MCEQQSIITSKTIHKPRTKKLSQNIEFKIQTANDGIGRIQLQLCRYRFLHHINALDTGLQIYIEKKKTCIKMLVIWD